MARSVDDVALLFSVLAGPDPRSPTSQETPGTSFYPLPPVDISKLTIAVTEDFGSLPVEAEVRSALRDLRTTLTDAGARVVDASPDFTDASRIFHVLRAASFRAGFSSRPAEEQAELKDTIIWNMQAGEALTNDDYDWVTQARAGLLARMSDFFAQHDLLIGPTTQVRPFSLDTEWVHEIEGQAMETYIQWMESCSWITVTCSPALSLPIGFAGQLPIGAQLIAPQRQDAFLLGAAKSIEALASSGGAAPDLDAWLDG